MPVDALRELCAGGSRARRGRQSRPWRSTTGVVDIELKRFRYDPTAPPASRLHYQAQARLREGVWECPKLPFPVNDLSADFGLEDGLLTIKRAQGSNGLTTLLRGGNDRAAATRAVPLDLHRRDRPRARPAAPDHTPAEYDELWDVFQPSGRVDAESIVVRGKARRAGRVGCEGHCATTSRRTIAISPIRSTT